MKTPILVIIFSIIFWSLFFNFAKAQPGPIQTQEAGISNYQIQATTPTTTPITGKQYLYNANDVLSTKDSLNNVQRVNKNYDNYVPNFDMEQGLTPYVFTGVTATLNTTTQLEGLKSINFDATAINDFIETPLITLPRVLMGQTCMVKINIKGGDANLQMQVVNGAGTIVGMKQMAVFADSTPQFITFNCPTQALITATPALGQLKIKVVQSTATNSALATLDSFYLGRFESNTMTVQGEGQENLSVGTGVLPIGDFAFTGTYNLNPDSLFTTTSNKITAKTKIKLNINFSTSCGDSTGPSFLIGGIYCTVNGTESQFSRIGRIDQAINMQFTKDMTLPGITLNTGDSCRINIQNIDCNNSTTGWSSFVSATPLPQLATIVNTNTPRAGFYAGRTWSGGACTWNWTAINNSPTSATAVAGCAALAGSPQGFATADATLDGQLPQITISKLKKGNYLVCATSSFVDNTQDNQGVSIRISNGTLSSALGQFVAASAVNAAIPTVCGNIFNPSDINSPTQFGIQMVGNGANQNVFMNLGANAREFSLMFYYQPDLSDPYSIPDLFAALPPQVQNSSGKEYRFETCYITNGGTAALASPSCNSWISSVTRFSVGFIRAPLITGIFSSPPICQCTRFVPGAGNTSARTFFCSFQEATINQLETSSADSSGGGVASDANLFISCGGFK